MPVLHASVPRISVLKNTGGTVQMFDEHIFGKLEDFLNYQQADNKLNSDSNDYVNEHNLKFSLNDNCIDVNMISKVGRARPTATFHYEFSDPTTTNSISSTNSNIQSNINTDIISEPQSLPINEVNLLQSQIIEILVGGLMSLIDQEGDNGGSDSSESN